MPQYDYRIASGLNNAGSLVNVENIADGSGRLFFAPEGLGSLDVNLQRTVGLTVSQSGYEQIVWRILMSSEQYVYWRATYCASGYSGNVTIRTTTEQFNTYANYNARMFVPPVAQLNRVSDSYVVDIQMTLLEAL